MIDRVMLKTQQQQVQKNRGSGTSITIRMPTTPTDIRMSGCFTRDVLGIEVLSFAISAPLPADYAGGNLPRTRYTKARISATAIEVFRNLRPLRPTCTTSWPPACFDDHDAMLTTDFPDFSAMNPAPFATTIGAPIAFESYFNATARWVGFVMMTSAVGTAAIMRFARHLPLGAADLRFEPGSPSAARLFPDFVARHSQTTFPFKALIAIVHRTDDQSGHRSSRARP